MTNLETISSGKRAMVIVTGDDVDHDLLSAAPFFSRVAAQAGFVPTAVAGLQRFIDPFPVTRQQDVFLFYKAGGEFSPPQQAAFADLIRGGKGVLAIHCSNVMGSVDPADSPNFRTWFEVLGNRYLSHGPGHHQGPQTIEIVAEHPITDGVTDFDLFDEFYEFEPFDDQFTVLAQRRRNEDGEIIPVLYAREFGEGRVVYFATGHDFRAWGQPPFQKLVRQALAWIAHES